MAYVKITLNSYEVVLKAYRLARTKSASETGLEEESFPEQRPYKFADILNKKDCLKDRADSLWPQT